MGLLQNITLHAQYPYKRRGGTATASETATQRSQMGILAYNQLTRFAGEAQLDDKASIPYGYSPGFFFALKSGGMSSLNNARGTATVSADLTRAKDMEGASAGSCTVSGDLSMVVSCEGTAAGSSTATADLVGVINLSASITCTATVTADIGAIASCSGSSAGSCSVSGDMNGLCNMSADVYVNQSTATVNELVDGVWEAAAADHNTSGTMGQKLNGAGSAGDPWGTDLSAYTTEGTAGKKLKEALTKTGFLSYK